MIKKMMRTTLTAAGFAALLLSGACASTNDTMTTTENSVVEVRPEDPSATGVAPGPAIADSDGNVYSSSAAPGRGNPATVGTNTNVNHIAGNSSVTVRETTDTTMVSESTVDTNRDLDTARDTVVTEPVTTTVRTETVDVPMTSSVQETTTTTTTETTPTRTRMRKD